MIQRNQKRSQAIAEVMKYYDDYSVENNAKLAKIVAYEKFLTASWEVNVDEVGKINLVRCSTSEGPPILF